MVSWWAAKGGSRQHDVRESRDFQVSGLGSRVLTLPLFAVDFSALIASVGGVLAGRLPCPLSLLFGVQALGEQFGLK